MEIFKHRRKEIIRSTIRSEKRACMISEANEADEANFLKFAIRDKITTHTLCIGVSSNLIILA